MHGRDVSRNLHPAVGKIVAEELAAREKKILLDKFLRIL